VPAQAGIPSSHFGVVRERLWGRVDDRFDPVPVRIDEEGRVVMWPVVRARAGHAVVGAPDAQCGGVEGIDSGARRGRKRQMKAVARRCRLGAKLQAKQVVVVDEAVANRGVVFKHAAES